MKFLRNLLASILGCLVAFGVLFFMLLIFAALAGGQEKTITVSDNSILEIGINEPLKDYGGRFDFTDFGMKFEKYDGLNHLLQAIKKAKADDHIKGISINSKYLPAGMAQVKAIRDAVADFRTSGKFVYAYGDFYSQKDYYLASVADSVFVNPVGDIEFKGLSSEVLFFKDLQEKSGVKLEVIRHGKYKSAVEPFLENKMSPENREQISELLHSVWGSMLEDIAASRRVHTDALDVIADDLDARTPPKAIKAQLVDRIAYPDEYEASLKKACGLGKDEELKYIGTEEYAEHVANKSKKAGKDRIAVIYAEGDIVYGEGSKDYVGQGIITRALKKARKDDKVKAIVLRINSPGGSALASDIIWREVEITKREKPVIVSMSNLAASGGYYIAAGADRIFAESNTITGSIGVFGMLPNFKQLADRWGISAEQVVTNKRALGYSVFEPLSEEYREVTREGIENIYATFIGHVAEGRGMSVDEVDSIAQGRVWSGREALEIGLVDEIGGLDNAIGYAAETSGAKEYAVENYPVYTTSIDEIMDKFIGVSVSRSKESVLKEEIGEEAYRILQKIKVLSQQKGVQARLPFELIVR